MEDKNDLWYIFSIDNGLENTKVVGIDEEENTILVNYYNYSIMLDINGVIEGCLSAEEDDRFPPRVILVSKSREKILDYITRLINDWYKILWDV